MTELWKPLLEIAIIWFVFYWILVSIKGTRAIQVLKGLVILFIAFFIAQIFHLTSINWLLTKIFAISIIALLIIFQPELRRGLAHLGRNRFFAIFSRGEETVNEIVKACTYLSKRKIGALIAIEKDIGLKVYIESGVAMDAKVTSELIQTIFMPNTPLHDGGVVIKEERLAASGCLFPLTQNPSIGKTVGTRHRAALGLTEETDAACVVISEETGAISVAIGGKLTRDLEPQTLRKVLRNLYISRQSKQQVKHSYWRFKKQRVPEKRQ
ncbi:MAG: diadenylate cyclase CdaA [Candidatus Omnitrophota bacterium]|nr:diadenylate cyclase CdaA [Candidatus Omnitrophota bacterium]